MGHAATVCAYACRQTPDCHPHPPPCTVSTPAGHARASVPDTLADTRKLLGPLGLPMGLSACVVVPLARCPRFTTLNVSPCADWPALISFGEASAHTLCPVFMTRWFMLSW